MPPRENGEPRQLPLDLGHGVGSSRDDLMVGRANQAAVALIDLWPRWPSPVVILAGPPGAGKSHLAAIWREASGAGALRGADLGEAAVEAALAGPVLIDDVDAGPIDERGLFHVINAVRSAGTSLLLTSRSFPAAWGVRLRDLASRLKAASTVEIHEPDDALLAAVLTKLFADRQVDVEPHVVQFLVRRIERSLAGASEVVARLDRAALEQKSRISRALAAQVVAGMEQGRLGL